MAEQNHRGKPLDASLPLGAMSVRKELERRLAELPGVVARPSRWGHGSAYFVGDREIAHLHRDGRIDIRLTKERLRELKATGDLDARVRTRGPSAEWAVVTLAEPRDVGLALHLVDEAVRANA
jgi:hypothetical protein